MNKPTILDDADVLASNVRAAQAGDAAALEFTDTTNCVNDELIRFHDAAHLLRSLPAPKVPTTIIDAITTMISDSTAAGATDSYDRQ